MKKISLFILFSLVCLGAYAQAIMRGVDPSGNPRAVAVDSNGNLMVSTPFPNTNNIEHYEAAITNQTPVVLANPTQTYGHNYSVVGLTTTNSGAVTVSITIRANQTPVWGPQSLSSGSGAVVPYPMPVPTNAGQVDAILDKVSTPGSYVDILLRKN